ncbi:acyltransferase family protein [Streptomyces sp. A7024]|uniref:Acyltransferase family protein n=1 Tax=Streptomyces coryli TaxID=1128680 RepID=A0A6G4TVE1_9ACTN|nr:acyltransferase family protein [Streptomyces coryli]NGN63490.1 acyltransferase family protein [Streptomyces coryli]
MAVRTEALRAAELPERRPELDAVRMLVVLGLIFFHSALVYASDDDYYVKSPETTGAIMIVAGFAVVWAMPALFFISGFGSWISLRRRGAGGFVKERLLRLGVPLVFATVVLNPLPQWLRERSYDARYHESYAAFLRRFYDVHLDLSELPFLVQGEHFETGHLWFVVLLVAFSLLLAPLYRWLPHAPVRRVSDRVVPAALRWRGLVLLPALAFAVILAFARMEENYAGWHRWTYLMFFAAGCWLTADDRWWTVLRRDAALAGWLGAGFFLACAPGVAMADEPFTDMSALAISARALFGAAGWCLVLALVGLLDRRRQRRRAAGSLAQTPPKPGRLYGYLAPAVLPIYILHQPVVVAVAYFLIATPLPLPLEYAALVAIAFALTLAVYELLVRRLPPLRFLFGMRG